jgi:hypothetical protein
MRPSIASRKACRDFPCAETNSIQLAEDPESELPEDDDVIIWHLEDRDDLDAYRVTKGSTALGEFDSSEHRIDRIPSGRRARPTRPRRLVKR